MKNPAAQNIVAAELGAIQGVHSVVVSRDGQEIRARVTLVEAEQGVIDEVSAMEIQLSDRFPRFSITVGVYDE